MDLESWIRLRDLADRLIQALDELDLNAVTQISQEIAASRPTQS